MRRILDICVEMDETAQGAYERLAEGCSTDAVLQARLRHMAADEAEHVHWWRELLEAWDRGLLPDIVNEPEALAARLRGMLTQVRAAVPSDASCLTPEETLTIATKIEFFMLDPCFGELLDLMEPGISSARHEAYSAHLELLISTIEEYFPKDSLAAFLAQGLRRTWRDNRTLATYAMRDPLTGLHNRRAWNAHLKQWTAWAARYGRPLSVMLIDVDNFRAVNDTHGHSVGDTTLLTITEALTRSVRSSDLVARYGGDEFAILAPETDRELIKQLSERVLETVREIGAVKGDDVHVTVSIGTVVASDHEGSAPRTLEELLAAADQALHSAKEMGRDRAAEPVVLSRA
jgi:diguanylate cyclase (GGDEF)-like protein